MARRNGFGREAGLGSHLQRACNFFASETSQEGTCDDSSLWNQGDMTLIKRPSMCYGIEVDIRSETIGARWCSMSVERIFRWTGVRRGTV